MRWRLSPSPGLTGEVDGPRQTAQRHLERRRPAAVYYRREGYWATGFVMMAGQFIGARAGSPGWCWSKGQSLIRPMIVIVSAVMSAKLLYDSHGAEILQWLGNSLMQQQLFISS